MFVSQHRWWTLTKRKFTTVLNRWSIYRSKGLCRAIHTNWLRLIAEEWRTNMPQSLQTTLLSFCIQSFPFRSVAQLKLGNPICSTSLLIIESIPVQGFELGYFKRQLHFLDELETEKWCTIQQKILRVAFFNDSDFFSPGLVARKSQSPLLFYS